MTRNYVFAALLIITFSFSGSAKPKEQGRLSATPIEQFQATDTRALEMFRQLAEKAHVVLGVSGTLVGSDHTLISVNLSHSTVGEVLNAITANDSRYSWRDMPDGTIEVAIEQHPLDLLQIVVHHWSVDHPVRYELTDKLGNLEEIKVWLQEHSCELAEFFIGAPPAQVLDIKASGKDATLRGILNEIAEQTGTYFWSAIQYSENPCAINLRP